MRKTYLTALFTVLFLSFSITSCSNDDHPTSTDTSAGNYWPMTLNNHWTLETNGTSTTSTILGTDVFGDLTYYKLSNPIEGNILGFDAQEWVAKKGATYYKKIGDANFTMFGISATMKSYEMPILKDNLEVGKTWSGTTSSEVTYTIEGTTQTLTIPVSYTGTILEKGATETVNGKTYSDVIKSSLKGAITIGDQTTNLESETWFAKGVGPIREAETSKGQTTERILTDHLIH